MAGIIILVAVITLLVLVGLILSEMRNPKRTGAPTSGDGGTDGWMFGADQNSTGHAGSNHHGHDGHHGHDSGGCSHDGGGSHGCDCSGCDGGGHH